MQQRLFEILYWLTQKEGATAPELAERFGVSKRTIYRDIDALSSAGIPVYTERGKGGGIRILPGYTLDRSLFSKQEQQQLVSHFQSLVALGTPGTTEILEKLSALFGEGENWLEIDFAPWGSGEAAQRMFAGLKEAILERRRVRFDYTGADGKRGHRLVEPVRILFRDKGWYLYAFSVERQAFRYFKLTRIHDFAMTGEGFTHDESLEDTQLALPPIKLVEVRLLFGPQMAFRIFDEFDEATITATEAGYLVDCALPPDEWLYGYLLSFGSGVKVVEPIEVREELLCRLKEILALYAQEGERQEG